MLLASLLVLPLWLTIPAYFAIGVVWAVLYLPRSVTLQARRYVAWRDAMTAGRPLEQVLGAKTNLAEHVIHPDKFQEMRDHHGNGEFSERRILVGFMVNIAFWPLRILEKFICDFLSTVWDAVWRTLRLWLCDLWRKVIVPACRWLYRRFVSVYQAIIQRANREAIADLELLNNNKNEVQQ